MCTPKPTHAENYKLDNVILTKENQKFKKKLSQLIERYQIDLVAIDCICCFVCVCVCL